MNTHKIFTRTIWTLGFVSLFSDIASEMLYPIMPIYLKSIGFTALWIGILEGIAEAVVGLSKGYFGKLSDEKGMRMPFVRMGYFLSSISKPMMTLFVFPLWIFLARASDRLGKGMRTGARDAVLSDECSKENKGKVFGFHRAMDTLGAAIGPIAALAYLYFFPQDYKSLFLIAFAPAMIGVVLTFFIKEKKKSPTPTLPIGEGASYLNPPQRGGFRRGMDFLSYFSYWKKSSPEYRQVVAGLLLFAVFNSSDVFLLLMAKQIGIADDKIIMVYIFYNLIYALFSLPFGNLADRIGMKKTFALGLFFFCITYAGMAFVQSTLMLFALFFIYGLYAAANEGVSKAWISKIVPQGETATAIGFFASGSSIVTMISSATAGLIWVSAGAQTAFVVSAVGAFSALIYIALKAK
ncbi:MAG: MFS transporter [Bacteroidetes bacterium]|nr:MFS transporter [Bacteroidota bacterium]